MTGKDRARDVSRKLDVISEGVRRWKDVSQKHDIYDKIIDFRPRFISAHYHERDSLTTLIVEGGLVTQNQIERKTGISNTAMIGTEKKGYCIGNMAVEGFSRNIQQLRSNMNTGFDQALKYALKCYLEEISEGVTIKNEKNYSRLSGDEVLCIQEPLRNQQPLKASELKRLREFTQDLLGHAYIKSSDIKVFKVEDRHYFCDSQGRKIFNTMSRDLCSISVLFDHESGSKREYIKNILNPKYSDLDNMLNSLFNDIITHVNQESTAPSIKSGQYPIILGPSASGTLFHEGLGGHLLSGEYISTGESTAFRDKIGERTVPLDITVIDNPLDKKGHGYYTFDEEGIPAKKTVLIEDGILRNYLLNRTAAAYFGTISNGHSRSEWVTGLDEEKGMIEPVLPEPRTSNMEISSRQGVTDKQLELMLREQCIKEGIDFGLYVDATNGAVDVGTSEFNIYPHSMWKIYVDGRKERVTDGIIVGNAYELLKQIRGIGKKTQVSLGTCGSTSGGVPVQERAPAIFLPQVTVTAVDRVRYTKRLMD